VQSEKSVAATGCWATGTHVVGGRRGGGGGDARAASAVANRGEVVARRLGDTGIHGGAVRRGLRRHASIHVS